MASHAYERAMALTAPRPCCGAPMNEPDECAENARAQLAAESAYRDWRCTKPQHEGRPCRECDEIVYSGSLCGPCRRNADADLL